MQAKPRRRDATGARGSTRAKRRRALALWAVAATVAVGAPSTGRSALDEIELKVLLSERQIEMVKTLEAWVNQNTGTYNLEGLRAFAPQLASRLEALGFAVEVRPGPEIELPGRGRFATGPLVIARRPAQVGAETAPTFLLNGHYDTVFEPGSGFDTFRVSEESAQRARGPGVADMKGGLVVMLEALWALREAGDLDRANWIVLLNGDEELGSLGSRETIETLAREADFGFVFESAQGNGSMVRSRRGLGQFHVAVEGVSAHAGSAHERGRSAIRELAHKILAIEELTDYERGVTLNVGLVRGGAKRNIVPAKAEAWIDLRYDDRRDGEAIQAKLEDIAAAPPTVAGTRTTLWGTLHRPPKEPTPEVERLLSLHAEVERSLGGQPAEPRHTGGGTDGSLMGAVGLATLDSMGALGGRAHTDQEFVHLPSLSGRATVAALLLRRLIRAQLYAPPGGR